MLDDNVADAEELVDDVNDVDVDEEAVEAADRVKKPARRPILIVGIFGGLLFC
jgi:hypothetical protein